MVGNKPAEPPGSVLDACHGIPIPEDPFHHRSHEIRQTKGRDSQRPTFGAQVGTEPSDFSLLTDFPLPFVAQVREMMGE